MEISFLVRGGALSAFNRGVFELVVYEGFGVAAVVVVGCGLIAVLMESKKLGFDEAVSVDSEALNAGGVSFGIEDVRRTELDGMAAAGSEGILRENKKLGLKVLLVGATVE